MNGYTEQYLEEAKQTLSLLSFQAIEQVVEILSRTRDRGGRIFFLGVGGSAANASHAAADFRKICGIESYSVSDNTAELTARSNDESWLRAYAGWLEASRLRSTDTLFVLSVGGGDEEKGLSLNLIEALRLGQRRGANIVGIVGRQGGYTAQVADAFVLVPTVAESSVTAHAESAQGTLWHLMVNHPRLKQNEPQWEKTCMACSERSFSIATA
ncbi:SIS domain-containing protein [Silvibacterium dinghuense]|uniref:SIS domain-containing protein n=1 Tax=Silvibacterium dinghuense TaxID=1560006 RepID=A0A4Q1SH43_9BACT|nr:SIS domain-containing protein [Silvibacterium dinghuense]RXS96689.1 SIS domain-containing protein [Silvibacterium dinghuense]